MIDPSTMDPSMNDDMLSLSMFWAGALMVATPVLSAAAVLAVWWRVRGKGGGGRREGGGGGDGER